MRELLLARHVFMPPEQGRPQVQKRTEDRGENDGFGRAIGNRRVRLGLSTGRGVAASPRGSCPATSGFPPVDPVALDLAVKSLI
jgi:hypothetical protein